VTLGSADSGDGEWVAGAPSPAARSDRSRNRSRTGASAHKIYPVGQQKQPRPVGRRQSEVGIGNSEEGTAMIKGRRKDQRPSVDEDWTRIGATMKGRGVLSHLIKGFGFLNFRCNQTLMIEFKTPRSMHRDRSASVMNPSLFQTSHFPFPQSTIEIT
jgi:hypothetical protein